jgi:hypothetical protein
MWSDRFCGAGGRAGAALGSDYLRAVSSLAGVSGKSERRAARAAVAEYHEAELGKLVARVGEAVDRYRAGELDSFEVDRVLFQYSRAARELWKYCNLVEVEIAAAMIREQPRRDWWECGAPRER